MGTRIREYLLLAGLMGAPLAVGYGFDVQKTHAYRVADAASLSESILQLFLVGEEGQAFGELRGFYQTHTQWGLTGVQLLNEAGRVTNAFPREYSDANKQSTMVLRTGVKGADDVERAQVALHYDWRFPAPSAAELPWGLGGLLLAVFFKWTQGRRRLKQVEQENERLRQEAEIQRMKAEQVLKDAQIERVSGLWDDFHVILDERSGQLANRLQEMAGLVAKLNTNLDDAVHDLRKAPLVGTDNLSYSAQLIRKLEDPNVQLSRPELVQFIRSIDRTIETIKWVIDELPQIASLQSEAVPVREELKRLQDNLPPILKGSWLKLHVDTAGVPLWIVCNRAHFRSIIKNALYNASSALQNKVADDLTFPAEINIRCLEKDGRVGVVIEDNGPGLSDKVRERLYRTKVHDDDEPNRGKGSIVVSAYLELHSGKVEVENRTDGGARVTFWFVSNQPEPVEQRRPHVDEAAV